MIKCKFAPWFRWLSCMVLLTFSVNVLGEDMAHAWSVAEPQIVSMPLPGTLLPTSLAFSLPTLKGISIEPNDPFKIDFIVDTSSRNLTQPLGQEQVNLLVKYFLSFLTIPEKDLWVNLSPYEKDRIITSEFETTNAGRDMLVQDYILKQLASSLTYPDHKLGQTFWKKVYKRALSEYGTTELPINTYSKVWVVPDRAVVYEGNGSAFISESRLKVLTEEDYLSIEKNSQKMGFSTFKKQEIDHLSTEVTREIIIPELEREVNTGRYFAPLRQMYNSLILAIWFKKSFKHHLIAQVYVDQRKTSGIALSEKQIKEKIFAQYLKAYKKGVYNYIKEEPDLISGQTIPRKYFSGGFSFVDAAMHIIYEPSSRFNNAGAKISALIREGLSRCAIALIPDGATKKALLALAAGAAIMVGGAQGAYGQNISNSARQAQMIQSINEQKASLIRQFQHHDIKQGYYLKESARIGYLEKQLERYTHQDPLIDQGPLQKRIMALKKEIAADKNKLHQEWMHGEIKGGGYQMRLGLIGIKEKQLERLEKQVQVNRVQSQESPMPTVQEPPPTFHPTTPTVQEPLPTVHTTTPTVQEPPPTVHTTTPTVQEPPPTVHTTTPTVQEPPPTVHTTTPTVQEPPPTVHTTTVPPTAPTVDSTPSTSPVLTGVAVQSPDTNSISVLSPNVNSTTNQAGAGAPPPPKEDVHQGTYEFPPNVSVSLSIASIQTMNGGYVINFHPDKTHYSKSELICTVIPEDVKRAIDTYNSDLQSLKNQIADLDKLYTDGMVPRELLTPLIQKYHHTQQLLAQAQQKAAAGEIRAQDDITIKDVLFGTNQVNQGDVLFRAYDNERPILHGLKAPLWAYGWDYFKPSTLNKIPIDSFPSANWSLNFADHKAVLDLVVSLSSPLYPWPEDGVFKLNATILPSHSHNQDLDNIQGIETVLSRVREVPEIVLKAPVAGRQTLDVKEGDHVIGGEVLGKIAAPYEIELKSVLGQIKSIDTMLSSSLNAEGQPLVAGEEIDLKAQRASLEKERDNLKHIVDSLVIRAPDELGAAGGVIRSLNVSTVIGSGAEIMHIGKGYVYAGSIADDYPYRILVKKGSVKQGDPVIAITQGGKRSPGIVTEINNAPQNKGKNLEGLASIEVKIWGNLQEDSMGTILLPTDLDAKLIVQKAGLADQAMLTNIKRLLRKIGLPSLVAVSMMGSSQGQMESKVTDSKTNNPVVTIENLGVRVGGNKLTAAKEILDVSIAELRRKEPKAFQLKLILGAVERDGHLDWAGGASTSLGDMLSGSALMGPAIDPKSAAATMFSFFGGVTDWLANKSGKAENFALGMKDVATWKMIEEVNRLLKLAEILLVDLDATEKKMVLLNGLKGNYEKARVVIEARLTKGYSSIDDLQKLNNKIDDVNDKLAGLERQKIKDTVDLNGLMGVRINLNHPVSTFVSLDQGNFGTIDDKTKTELLALATGTNSPSPKMQEAFARAKPMAGL